MEFATASESVRTLSRLIADARKSLAASVSLVGEGSGTPASGAGAGDHGAAKATASPTTLAAILIRVLSSDVLKGKGAELGEDVVEQSIEALSTLESCSGAVVNVRDNLSFALPERSETGPLKIPPPRLPNLASGGGAVQEAEPMTAYDDDDLYSRYSASPFRGEAPSPTDEDEDNGHPACAEAEDVPMTMEELPPEEFEDYENAAVDKLRIDAQVRQWKLSSWQQDHEHDTDPPPPPPDLLDEPGPESDDSIAKARQAALQAAVWMAASPSPASAVAMALSKPSTGSASSASSAPSSPTEHPAVDSAALQSQSPWACTWPSKAEVDEMGSPTTFTAFRLRVVYEAGKTGFADEKDFVAKPGSVVAGRFHITRRLGSAAFSSAVAAVDLASGREVCLKIIKNNKEFVDQSLDEVRLLEYANRRAAYVLRRFQAAKADGSVGKHGVPTEEQAEAAGRVLRLIDFFYYKEHLFIVTELLKDNLYEFQKFVYLRGLPPFFTHPRVARVARQVLMGLQFIHSLGILHCDLKPENLLLSSYGQCRVKIIDFGSSCFITDHLTTYIQSRSYRAPEVVLGHAYGPKIDVWSLGCILFELITGRVLFVNDEMTSILARMQSVLGPFPPHLVDKGDEASKFFTAARDVYEPPEKESDSFLLLKPVPCPLDELLGEHASDRELVDFLSRLLTLDPVKRPTAGEALAHPFMRRAAAVEPYEIPPEARKDVPTQLALD